MGRGFRLRGTVELRHNTESFNRADCRTPQDHPGLYLERVAADSAYGSTEMLGWLVHERGIEPHIPVFGKSRRSDGTFSRDDFAYDHKRDCYICLPGMNE